MRLIGRLFAGFLAVIISTMAFAIWHPRSPLPDAWNPIGPFDIAHPLTPLTQYKLKQVLKSPDLCLSALSTGATFTQMPDLNTSNRCHIRNRVELRAVAGIPMRPVETRCQTALRLAMWAQQGIKPAAKTFFNQNVTQIHHSSSFSCRQIRTPSGSSGRMSTHATANAIDVSGVTLSDGQRLTLLTGWTADDNRAPFFRDLRATACKWFRVTLGPDYNALHADHFHLQNTGWGLCS